MTTPRPYKHKSPKGLGPHNEVHPVINVPQPAPRKRIPILVKEYLVNEFKSGVQISTLEEWYRLDRKEVEQIIREAMAPKKGKAGK